MEDKLVKIGEAAKVLGVSKTSLRRWDKDNILCPLKTPGQHRLYSYLQLKSFYTKEGIANE